MSNTQLKERGLPSSRAELKAIREQWANITNKHLKEAKIDARIDHRSHKDRGLEQLPTKKLGWEASALERKGIKTATGDYNRKVEEYNHAMQQLAIIEKSLNAVTEQREQSNDRLREGIERAVKLIESATHNTAWADKRARQVNKRVNDSQQGIEGAEREIDASTSAINQADRRIAEHQQSKLKAEREAQLQQQAKELLLQNSQELHAQAVKGERAVDAYHTRLADIERQFEQLSLKPLKKELAELQQAYDTAKKPMMTSQSKWSKQQLEKRTVLRSLERQISVKEFQDRGKYKQHAKDWIAKNEPQTVQEVQQGQQAIKEYKEQQKQQEPKVEQLRVRTSQSKDKGMER
jgi:chromosome segregation ATPase